MHESHPDFARAWDANFQAVQQAKRAIEQAMQTRIAVETAIALECKNKRRDPTAEELARCSDLRDRWLAAKDALTDARSRFKAGVTADQLGAD